MKIIAFSIGEFEIAVSVTRASAKRAAKAGTRKPRASKSAEAVPPPSTPTTEEEQFDLIPFEAAAGSIGHGGASNDPFEYARHTADTRSPAAIDFMESAERAS